MDKYILTYNKDKKWYIAELENDKLVPAKLTVEQLEEINTTLNQKALIEHQQNTKYE
jgi:hypothetical protein